MFLCQVHLVQQVQVEHLELQVKQAHQEHQELRVLLVKL
jgi:hypothetical protein